MTSKKREKKSRVTYIDGVNWGYSFPTRNTHWELQDAPCGGGRKKILAVFQKGAEVKGSYRLVEGTGAV